MADNMERVGMFAQIATAAAAVTYPIVKVMHRYIALRRERLAKQYAAPAAEVEARLTERHREFEERLDRLEHRPRRVA